MIAYKIMLLACCIIGFVSQLVCVCSEFAKEVDLHDLKAADYIKDNFIRGGLCGMNFCCIFLWIANLLGWF